MNIQPFKPKDTDRNPETTSGLIDQSQGTALSQIDLEFSVLGHFCGGWKTGETEEKPSNNCKFLYLKRK